MKIYVLQLVNGDAEAFRKRELNIVLIDLICMKSHFSVSHVCPLHYNIKPAMFIYVYV